MDQDEAPDCVWCQDGTKADHRNIWTHLTGRKLTNALCDKHQGEYLEIWRRLGEGAASEVGREPKRDDAPTKAQIIKAWAGEQGITIRGRRVPYHVELQWRDAGRPNPLE